jgi:diaminohydroxyphosphoribosylaminopyrimidine deaminase/5-amino-6-(5-phosphoribosylamino)uracil reductase
LVHQWRSQEQAILVGQGTVLADNPRLNVRGIAGTNPIRVIIDPDLKIDSTFHIFNNTSSTLIFNHLKDSQTKNISLIKVSAGRSLIPNLLQHLYERNIQSVLVEGGAQTLQSFMDLGCWDEARVFTGQVEFKEGLPAPELKGKSKDQVDISGDILNVYSNPAFS